MDAEKISFDQIQLALDIADKDWYREAADRASIPSTYLRTRAQVREDKKLARGGMLYKPSQDHRWRAAIATKPIAEQQRIKHERKTSQETAPSGRLGRFLADSGHVSNDSARRSHRLASA